MPPAACRQVSLFRDPIILFLVGFTELIVSTYFLGDTTVWCVCMTWVPASAFGVCQSRVPALLGAGASQPCLLGCWLALLARVPARL